MAGQAGRASYLGSGLLVIDYGYDKLGRIIQKYETIAGVTSRYDYRYDARGNLQAVLKNGAETARYVYDGNGNRLSGSANGAVEKGRYDPQDRLVRYGGTAYAYGPAGKLKTRTENRQQTQYRFDALGDLSGVTLPAGSRIDYLLDGRQRRIGKKRDGALAQGFLYQGELKPAVELDGAGAIVSRFVYATRSNVPDYMIRGGQRYRILTDHIGSPRLVVNASDGSIAQRIDYDLACTY